MLHSSIFQFCLVFEFLIFNHDVFATRVSLSKARRGGQTRGNLEDSEGAVPTPARLRPGGARLSLSLSRISSTRRQGGWSEDGASDIELIDTARSTDTAHSCSSTASGASSSAGPYACAVSGASSEGPLEVVVVQTRVPAPRSVEQQWQRLQAAA